MKSLRGPLGASVLLLIVAVAPLRAGGRELRTVEAAADTVRALGAIPLRGIPSGLVREAAGVAIIPHVFKAGFLLDGRFGRGVVMVRQADGTWGNPVFITLAGGGVGLQAGVESTDVVLVFRTRHSLDRILKGKGKLTLGGDVSIAAGPVGREAEAATDARLKAEIFSYSRSRGLFAGVSLEGAALTVNHQANERFYGMLGGQPAGVLGLRGLPAPAAVEVLKAALDTLGGIPLPVAPAVVVPPAETPPPPVPLPPPPPALPVPPTFPSPR